MDALKKTLFILALVFVTAYTVRHVYYKWFDPRESVLDKYSDSVGKQIKAAESIEQLTKMYDEAKKKVEAYEADKNNPEIEHGNRDEKEPYKAAMDLKTAIQEWERKSKEIFQLRFYWGVGLLLLAVGYIVFRKLNGWLGLTVIIVGFTEQVYWASPSFISGSGVEYDRLLTNKFLFSLATLVLLIAIAYFTDTLQITTKKTAS
ncbi:MAG: hypothetical protein HY961_18975 [Ignavibacteriae bacterium]|nr:hypothetical protein [Ignavibacteriota bacterium]